MRCHRNAALDCRTTELCEIMGCQAATIPDRAGVPQVPAAPTLNALERLAVRVHDRIEGLRKPAPEPPLPPLPSLTMEEVLSEIRTTLPEPAPAPAAPPPPAPPAPPPAPARPPAAKSGPDEIKVVRARYGGWVFVEGGAPVAVAVDAAGAGTTLAILLAG
jgi:hypothetical protein